VDYAHRIVEVVLDLGVLLRRRVFEVAALSD
jgi:hypothetical protein